MRAFDSRVLARVIVLLAPLGAAVPVAVAPAPRLRAVSVGGVVEPPVALSDTMPASAMRPRVDEVTLEVIRTSHIRAFPGPDSPVLGIAGTGAMLRPRGAPAFDREWFPVEPEGWVVASSVQVVTRPLAAVALLDADTVLRRVYGRVRPGATALGRRAEIGEVQPVEGVLSVRREGIVRRDGRVYWRATTGELIDAADIRRLYPSRFGGARLDVDDPSATFGWLQSRLDRQRPIPVRTAPGEPHRKIRLLEPRTIVPVEEMDVNGRAVRIGPMEWVDRADVRLIRPTEPPASLAPDERWIDVDLREQVLVVYQGRRPVYATLVSSGKDPTRTPTGVFRIQSKLLEARMRSDPDETEAYRVESVPFAMYFHGDFALHGVYWHDGFGERRSHGCVNLSPRDAEALFQVTEPALPPGWTTVHASAARPGTVVRVHR